MKLILGLGNPGAHYQNTRHNLGFLCLDHWCRTHKKGFISDEHYDYLLFKNAILLKPGTWMNRSGDAVRIALRRWDISESLVVYDDLELPPGSLRIRNGGGDGGHNGIKSLFEILPAQELKRFRIGIGKDESMDAADYVLHDISAAENEVLQPLLNKAVELLNIYIHRDFTAVLNEYSKWMKSYSSPKGVESQSIGGT